MKKKSDTPQAQDQGNLYPDRCVQKDVAYTKNNNGNKHLLYKAFTNSRLMYD